MELFNELVNQCIERYAPLKRTKITRPPVPWLNTEGIRDLQIKRNVLRHEAQILRTSDTWGAFREVRSLLWSKIKQARKLFIDRALSSTRPKEIWQTVYRILNPSPQPLRLDVDELNNFFASTAERTTGNSEVDIKEDLINFVQSLHPTTSNHDLLKLRVVTVAEVLREIKVIRTDASTGHDQLPAKYQKLVAEHIVGPLAHIINSFIKILSFPDAWKVARESPIPKVNHPVKNADMRPISILPVLSKVYEKLVHRQVVEFIESRMIFVENISGYRKGHSTVPSLGIRDDILHAMKRGELTLTILADLSKAFDTIRYKTILRKLSHLGFSKDYLIWTINYLSGRQHFVQTDDKVSDRCNVNFGVPRGSIMGPLIFNLYVEDMEMRINAKRHQYADDTTIYMHCRLENSESTVSALQKNVTELEHWAKDANLVLNPSKTKLMLLSTPQLSHCHSLNNVRVHVQIEGNTLERVNTSKLLGSHFHQHLKWEDNVKAIGSSYYAT